MKPIRYLPEQVDKIRSGEMIVDIRPSQFAINYYFNYHKNKWLWVKESFLVNNGAVVYYPDQRFNEKDFSSDCIMPMEYCRMFINIQKLHTCRLSHINDKFIKSFGLPNVNEFNSYWKEKYGILKFYSNPQVTIYRIATVEQIDLNTFLNKYFPHDQRILRADV